MGRGDQNARAVQRVVLGILLLNLLVTGAKAGYAFMSGSLAVASDAVHSLLDAASNVIGLVVLRFAAAPPDEGHPYGRKKLEIVAAAFIGVLIAAGSLRFAWSAVDALLSGRAPPVVTGFGLLIFGGTLVVNLFVSWYEARRGRELGSAFLIADAAHTASDVWVTIAVIAALLASWAGWGRADALVALGVIVVIGRVSWHILAANLGVLIDRAVVDAGEVRAIALSVPGVVGCHRVRSRGIDGAVLVDFHLLVDGGLPLREAHTLSHAVEDKLRSRFPGLVDVTIHVEPDEEPEEGL